MLDKLLGWADGLPFVPEDVEELDAADEPLARERAAALEDERELALEQAVDEIIARRLTP